MTEHVPTLSKILEKEIHKRTYNFLLKHKTLYESQYGFRAKHSTNDAITELITNITENFENKTSTLSVFLDLSKAFDTIDHNILLNKLNHYGIRGTALNWFRSYLTKRQQYVKINQCKSTKKQITCGVPQGSVLGPLLFIIYTNDLPNCLTYTHAILFADDTTIYTNSNNLKTLYDHINFDLNALDLWFKTNKLSLNVSKTNYMLFTNNSRSRTNLTASKIKIGNDDINQKNHVKFLGVIIDETLNWKQHILAAKNKISKTFYCLKMVKHILPQKTLKTLYQTLIQPHLDYGITFWGGAHNTNLNKLTVIQKKVIRNITNSKYNQHTDPLFKELKILKLKQLYTLQAAKLIYKATQGELPKPLVKLYKPNTEIHQHNTRQHNNPHIRYRRTQRASNQINHKGPEIWSNLNNHLKSCTNTKTFTNSLKQFLLNSN